MRFPKVLFVTPNYPGRYFGGVRPPVGISYIEEYAAAHGVATDAVDLNAGWRKDDLLHRIRRFQPSLVGFTMMTYQYLTTYNLIRELKARFPHTDFIVGGPHVSALEGEVLRQCPAADYAVAGEGEIPLRDLCLGVPPGRIAGLYSRDGEAVRSGGPRVYVDDLDQF